MTDNRAPEYRSATPWNFVVEEWRAGMIRMRCDIVAHHLNPSGTVHGGVWLTMMDEAGALCGLWRDGSDPPRSSVTVSLTGQFTAQIQGGCAYAVGQLVRSGSRIYFSRTEITAPDGTLLAFGSSTHRFRNTKLTAPAASLTKS